MVRPIALERRYLFCFWPTVVSAMQVMKALVCSVVKLTLVPNQAVVVAIAMPSAPRLGQVPITAHVAMVSVVMASRALLSIHVRRRVLGIVIATLIVSTLVLDRSVILDVGNFNGYRLKCRATGNHESFNWVSWNLNQSNWSGQSEWDTSSAINQSKFKATTCSRAKRGKMRAYKSRQV